MTTFLFIGCTEDELLDTTDKETAENNKYLLTRVDKLDIKSNTFLSNKLMEINQISNFKNTNSIDGDVNFSLNMNEAVYIESLDGLVHSYTFSVNSTNGSNAINNIVLVSHNDQDYKAYLTIYTLTAEEKERFLNGDRIDWIDKAFIEPFNIDRITTHGVGGGCVDLFKVDEADCTCHSEHAEGGCTHPKDILEWFEVDCPGGAGGASGGGNTGGENSGNPGGNPGGASGGGRGGSIPTSPINFTPQDPEECPDLEGDLDGNCSIDDFEMFVLNLAPEQADWWHNLASGAQKTEIKAFLLNNNYTQEAKEFVEAVINAWSENSDAEVDWEDRIILTTTFLNNIKAKFSYEKLNNNSNLRSILDDFYAVAGQGGFTPNLIFKIEQIDQCNGSDEPNACTRLRKTRSTIEITINSDYLDDNLSILMLCETILHESIHAAIYNASNSTETSFSEDFYLTLENFANNNNWQHEMMASKYVNLIAEGLEGVHPHICDEQFISFYSDNSLFNFEMFYTYLAWSGLSKTDENGNYVFDAATDFFEDPDTTTDENETVQAYSFHINAVNTNSVNVVSDECN